MENNNSGFSGQGYQGNHNDSNDRMGRHSSDHNQSGSNQDSAKFSQDNDDFAGDDPNMDNERNMSTGGFTGSDTSSTMDDSTGASFSDTSDSEEDDSWQASGSSENYGTTHRMSGIDQMGTDEDIEDWNTDL